MCQQYRFALNSIKMIAHRGASFEALENTRASVLKALEIGVDGIEIDVRLTKDGQVVLFHNKTIQGRLVAELTYPELLQMDPHIPLLKDILAIDRGSTFLFVEIKWNAPDLPALCAAVQKELQGVRNIQVGSFSPKVLSLMTGFPRFAIAHKKAEFEAFTEPVDGWALHHCWANTPEAAHILATSTLYYWTVDKPLLARTLRCHGLVTNKPREMKAALCR